MKIAIVAIGSLGDFLYYLPLAQALIRHGDSVNIIGHRNFAHLAKGHNVPFLSISLDSDAFLNSEEARRLNATSGNALRVYRSYTRLCKHHLVPCGKEIIDHCHEIDMIIASPLAIPIAYHIAEKLNIPLLRGSTFPMQETRIYPPAISISLTRLWFVRNKTAHRIEEYAEGRIGRRTINQFRTDCLGLSQAGGFFSYRRRNGDWVPQLLCMSPSIVPRPSDWPDSTHAYGVWRDIAEKKSPPTLSKQIEQFICDGATPIYIGFGSMSTVLANKIVSMVKDISRRTGERFILFKGAREKAEIISGTRILVIGHTPHSVLFPRVLFTIHHGGASTFHEATRSAKPSIVVPFAHDQGFWGERCFRLGVGPRPIPQHRLTAARLSAAIRTVKKMPTYWERAKQLQRQMLGEERHAIDTTIAALHNTAHQFQKTANVSSG